jgi:hypothetical protein
MAGQGDVGQGYVNEIIDLANSGDTSGFSKADWQIIADNAGYETPRAAAERAERAAKTQGDGDGDGSGSGSGSGGGTPVSTGPTQEERESARAYLRNLLSQYGLGSLADSVDSIIQDNMDENVIAERLRGTEAYKTRFKGLTQLRAKNITDIANEGEYLRLESNYRRVFREAGMSSFLGDAGSQSEFDSIAKLVGDYSLSVDEVQNRVTDAQRIVAETPQEVRDSFQRYYNVDPATLTAYVLDPTRTANEINKRANAAIIGGLGQQRGLEFGSGVAERIGTFLGGDQNLTGTQAEPILGEIADVQRSTGRLAQLEKGTLTAEETALAQLDLDTEAKRKVKGLQSRERARFGGTGAFGSSALSSSGKV